MMRRRRGNAKLRARHLKLARRKDYWGDAPPLDAGEAIAVHADELARRGYIIGQKRKLALPRLSKMWAPMSTTIDLGPDGAEGLHLVLVSNGFYHRTKREQALTLGHELRHVRQYEGMGRVLFFLRYAFAQTRWALEMQCYRGDLRDMRALGFSLAERVAFARRVAARLVKSYALGRLNDQQVCSTTERLLLEEAQK